MTPVRATQYMLRRWSPTLVTDGRFGFNTMAAVRKFQKAENLPVTGRLVTPAEWRRLYLRNAIAFGSRGNAVAAIQVTINTYWSGILGRVTVDGKFGPTMSAKIAAFQRHINRLTPGRLTVDGEVGVHTWHAIEPWSND